VEAHLRVEINWHTIVSNGEINPACFKTNLLVKNFYHLVKESFFVVMLGQFCQTGISPKPGIITHL
jgi:hypothetical protein